MDNAANNLNETLVRYMDGELTSEEKAAVEQYLTDAGARSAYEDLLLAKQAVQTAGLRMHVSSIHQSMMREMKTPVRKISSFKKVARYTIAVAASLLLIAGGYLAYSFYTLSPNGVFSANYQPYELTIVRDGQAALSPVENAYREKNYTAAAKLGASSTGTKEMFLAAMADIELKKNTAAINLLKKVLAADQSNHSTIVKDEAEYYLALAYLRNKDYDFALELLRSIRDNPDHIYNSKVSNKLIRQVKMLKWR
jgi:hypothetical protein